MQPSALCSTGNKIIVRDVQGRFIFLALIAIQLISSTKPRFLLMPASDPDNKHHDILESGDKLHLSVTAYWPQTVRGTESVNISLR